MFRAAVQSRASIKPVQARFFAVPKKKRSLARRRKRWTHLKLTKKGLQPVPTNHYSFCENCGAGKRAHYVCHRCVTDGRVAYPAGIAGTKISFPPEAYHGVRGSSFETYADDDKAKQYSTFDGMVIDTPFDEREQKAVLDARRGLAHFQSQYGSEQLSTEQFRVVRPFYVPDAPTEDKHTRRLRSLEGSSDVSRSEDLFVDDGEIDLIDQKKRIAQLTDVA
ncbi:MAG: hypothetical protein MHM6MM_000194 [Cercozoa sp. M6MM]